MPARRSSLDLARPISIAALLAAVSQGCSGAPPITTFATEPALCAPERLESCETRLLASLVEGPPRPLAAAYVAARAARDPADPWARLYRDLDASDRGPRPKALLLAEGMPAPAGATGARLVTTPALPAPAAIGADDLLLALASATGYQHVIRFRAGGVTQLFPGDPLAVYMGGLRPALHDDGAVAHLEADLAAEETLHAAFDAASGFRYVDAAQAAEKLAKAIDPRDPWAEPVLRWQFALQLLEQAGLVLDPEETADETPAKPPAPEAPPPRPQDTPYGSYLHVITAKSLRKEWEVRGPSVLTGIGADRREAFASMFVRARECEARRTPPMEGVRDLVFGNNLSLALPRDPGAALAPGQLPFREWLDRYEAMLGLVEATKTAWSFLPDLLRQRGESPGLSATTTPVYRRVTELGLAHLKAMRALEEAYAVRYRGLSLVGLATSQGTLGDDRLRQAVVQLVEMSVKQRLAAAKDGEALLTALLLGGAAGLSYPPALQEAHFLAMSDALAARLKGDFRDKTGWGVGLLYTIDAAYRLLTNQGARLDFSSTQVARALAAKDVPHPALASLATAAARYAALAAGGRLDPSAAPKKLTPERLAAQAELRAALAGLGDAPGEAPANVLDDVTTLTDGLVATLSSAIAAGTAKKPPPKAGTCAPKAATAPLDPGLRRTLARLGDVRRRILSHPRYKDGDGLWARRVRLLVTVLSDAMDLVVAGDTNKKPAFAVPFADAQKVVGDALRELSLPAVTDLATGGYGVFREIAAAKNPEDLLKKGSSDLRRVASALVTLFRGEGLGGKGPATGVALLDAFASMKAPTGDDLVGALTSYASVFYEKKQPDQGDLCLLAGLVISSFTHARAPEALAVAEKARSRIAWVLRFTDELRKPHESPDPSVYAAGMRQATDDACQAPDAEATLTVMTAIHDFAAGKRKEARAALDRTLEKADEEGLGVPRMAYRYEEKTANKVFQVTVDLSYANGILNGGNDFQLGLGFRTGGEPSGSLSSTLAPLDTDKAGVEAARYYVFTAALATVYHLLDGDTEHATDTGRRVIAALSAGVKLGRRTVRVEKPGAWGADAREVMVLAAQLAAEAGLPFLAGDLWTMVKQGLSETLDDKGVASVLDRPIIGTVGIKQLEAVTERARRSFKILSAPLACTDAKVELGGFEEVSCADYPLALSLRIADVLKKLPRLRRAAEANPHCGPLKSLDAFLAGGDKGAYDPDAFTRAVEELRADGKVYDAAILLARQKRAAHCNPTIVTAARELGRSPILGPWIRADLLYAAVNCTAATSGPELEADLVQIDQDTRRLPDPMRNLSLILGVADVASRTDQWKTLARLVKEPDFIGRWMSIHPNAAAAALLLDHAVATIEGQPVALERTKATRELLCETFKAPDRAELCGQIDALRAPLTGPLADRQRFAREAVKKLVAKKP
jgi:hypothetical protein